MTEGMIPFMKKSKLNEKLSELVGDIFEMPSPAVPRGYAVTLTDGRETNLTGCRAILSYSDELITAEVFGGVISVYGEGLDIARYNDAEITLRGRIEKIVLSEAEK